MNPPDIAVDLSVWQLFSNAHIVVKIVMIGLLAVSVWSWAIILEKFFLFAKTRKETDKFEQVFWSGQSLEELYQALAQRRNTGMAALFVAAMREWKRSLERDAGKPMPGVQLRVDKVPPGAYLGSNQSDGDDRAATRDDRSGNLDAVS